MASGKEIQIEDGGYTRIHNLILEILAKAHLSSLEFRIVLFVIRKTYGFHKKTDVISITQFMECGGSRRGTVTAIQNLIRLKVITRTKKGPQSFEYGFNKYFETWEKEVFESRRPGQGMYFHQSTGEAKDTGEVEDTGEAKDTGTGEAKDTHKRKKEIKRKGDAAEKTAVRNAMFSLVAKVCRMDMNLKRGHINTVVKRLVEAGYVPEDLEFFAGWWEKNDFRGRRGDPPTTKQLEDRIYEAKQVRLRQAEKAIKSEDTLFYVDVGTERQWWQGGELIRTEPIGANV